MGIALKNLLNNLKTLWEKITELTIGEQELVNFVFSLLLTIPLLLFLLFGIESDGTYKNTYVESAIDILLSITGVYLAFLLLIPSFLSLLLKAYLFDTPIYKSFYYIAQFITGVFYSLGFGLCIFASVTPKYGITFNQTIFTYGVFLIILGYALFHIFQFFIQRSSTPKI
jgi:hypothetical protein